MMIGLLTCLMYVLPDADEEEEEEEEVDDESEEEEKEEKEEEEVDDERTRTRTRLTMRARRRRRRRMRKRRLTMRARMSLTINLKNGIKRMIYVTNHIKKIPTSSFILANFRAETQPFIRQKTSERKRHKKERIIEEMNI